LRMMITRHGKQMLVHAHVDEVRMLLKSISARS
jgi:hypothetical protein